MWLVFVAEAAGWRNHKLADKMLYSLLAFVVVVGLHAVAVHLPRGRDSVTKFALIGGLVGTGLGIHVWCAGPDLEGLATLVAYAFACELYLFLFTLIGSSVSVRILLTLRDAPRTAAELETLYTSAGMVQARFDKLRAVGLLASSPRSRGRLTWRGRCLARLFSGLKRFFRHDAPAPPPHAGRSRQPSAIA